MDLVMHAHRAESVLDLKKLIQIFQDANIISSEHKRHSYHLDSSHIETEDAVSSLAKLAIQDISVHDQPPLTQERICQYLAELTDKDYVQIDPLTIDVNVCTRVMSFEFAQRHRLLAIRVNSTDILIATSDPYYSQWLSSLEQVTRKSITTVIAKPSDIERYRTEFYTLTRSIDGAVAKNNKAHVANFEQLFELGKQFCSETNDEEVVKIVDWLLEYAYEQRASDIHIEPRRLCVNIRFRIDSVLHHVYQFPQQVGIAVTSRLKILGRMNVAEKRQPQDGRIKTKFQHGIEIELRLSTLPTALGEKMVLRLFDPQVLLRSFSQLGLQGDNLKSWLSLMSQQQGIVFVTGPTGSGKTTTLYSSLKQLAKEQVNLCTIEEPIEMVEPSFNQMQVQPEIGLGFHEGLKALLRQDPDIIMIGEIRDIDTAKLAMQAALTGHLVIATMHTNDAVSAIIRLQDLGVPTFLIQSTLLGVMAQRLMRILCPHCKVASDITSQQWRDVSSGDVIAQPSQVYQALGCIQCRNSGYLGRTGVYEVLNLQQLALSDQCASVFTIEKIKQQANKQGMHSMRSDALQRVAQGQTSIAELLRVFA